MRVLLIGHDDAPARMAFTLRGSDYAPIHASLGDALPEIDAPEFADSLRDLAYAVEADWVVPTCGASARALGLAIEAGAVDGARVPFADPELIARLDDRRALLKALRCEVPTSRVALPGEIGWDRVFPAVLRSRFASADHGTSVVVQPETVEAFFGSDACMLEPYRGGDLVVVELVIDDEGAVASSWISRRTSTPEPSEVCEVQVRTHATRACTLLGIRGAATVFMRIDRDCRPTIMDVRPHFVPGGADEPNGGPLKHLLDLATRMRGPSEEVAGVRHARRVDKPWGHELIWADSTRYVGKILHIAAGEALSLQYHERKQETIHVLSGVLRYQVGPSETLLEDLILRPGDGYCTTPGTVHRMIAVTECAILEASTPDLDDVVRLEDRYGRTGTSAA